MGTIQLKRGRCSWRKGPEEQETEGERSRSPTSIISIPVRDFFRMTQLKRSRNGATRTEDDKTQRSGEEFRGERTSVASSSGVSKMRKERPPQRRNNELAAGWKEKK